MTVLFLYKQMQHTESILTLIPRRDAGLVARTMIEGLYQLLWVSQASEERAKRWRSYSIVHDWRLIQSQLQAGISVKEEVILDNQERLRDHGRLHRIKKQKAPSSDPYFKTWHGIQLTNMADVVGRDPYDSVYAELSDWAHWGVSGIGESVSREDGQVRVDMNSERVAGQSLLMAFQCMFQTLEVVDNHFSLNITEKIAILRENFIATMNSFSQA